MVTQFTKGRSPAHQLLHSSQFLILVSINLNFFLIWSRLIYLIRESIIYLSPRKITNTTSAPHSIFLFFRFEN